MPRRRRRPTSSSPTCCRASSMMPMLEGFLLQPTFVALRFQKWDDDPQDGGPGPEAAAAARGVALRARDGRRRREGRRRSAETLRGAYAASRATRVAAGQMAGPQNSAAALLRRRDGRARRPHRRGRGRPRGGARELGEGRRGRGRARLRRAARLVLPGPRVARRGAPARRRAPPKPRRSSAPTSTQSPQPRSLLGLAESLEAQGRTADAAWARAQFDAAWKDADTKLRLEDF